MKNRFGLRFDLLEVPCTEIGRSRLWYETVFGLSTIWSDDSHVLLEEGTLPGLGLRILLVKTDQSCRLEIISSEKGIQHSVSDFQVDELEPFHEHLREHGVSVPDLGPPVNDWAPRGFSFLDPDGNRFGVFAYASSSHEA